MHCCYCGVSAVAKIATSRHDSDGILPVAAILQYTYRFFINVCFIVMTVTGEICAISPKYTRAF